MLVDCFQGRVGEDPVAVSDRPWDPAREEMIAPCAFGGFYDGALLAWARAYEEHDAGAFGHGAEDGACAAEVRRCGV